MMHRWSVLSYMLLSLLRSELSANNNNNKNIPLRMMGMSLKFCDFRFETAIGDDVRMLAICFMHHRCRLFLTHRIRLHRWTSIFNKQFSNVLQITPFCFGHHKNYENNCQRTEYRVHPKRSGRGNYLVNRKKTHSLAVLFWCESYYTNRFQVVICFDNDEHDTQVEGTSNRTQHAALLSWEQLTEQQKWNAAESNGKTHHVNDETRQRQPPLARNQMNWNWIRWNRNRVFTRSCRCRFVLSRTLSPLRPSICTSKRPKSVATVFGLIYPPQIALQCCSPAALIQP